MIAGVGFAALEEKEEEEEEGVERGMIDVLRLGSEAFGVVVQIRERYQRRRLKSKKLLVVLA